MTLIKSISGIRGTIGGNPGDSLTPLDITKFSAAYGYWVKSQPELQNKLNDKRKNHTKFHININMGIFGCFL